FLGGVRRDLSLDIDHISLGSAAGRPSKLDKRKGGTAVNRPRAADDFATIRARMEELRHEREGTEATDNELQRDPSNAPSPRRASDPRRDQHRVKTGPPAWIRHAARSRQALVR